MRRFRPGILFLFICAHVAVAQISPGPLSRAHADLEGITNCTQCHESGQEINGAKCLTCHVEINNQIKSGHGFHFLNSASTCVTCHKEHLGVDAKITRFDEAQFDHAKTGFSLTGAHKSKTCEQCHATKNIKNADVAKALASHPHKTFQGLTPQCVSCHADKHRGTVGTTCETCHSATAWTPATNFDHGKARFTLMGKHATVECSKCHAILAAKPRPTPVLFNTKPYNDCTPCHASPHGRKFADKTCASCHTPKGWKVVASFDHSSTRFPLVGSHAQVACEKCHTQMNAKTGSTVSFATKQFEDCTPCHTSPHRPTFVKDNCRTCHSAVAWNVIAAGRFDHSRTQYALEGKHAGLECVKCHKSAQQASFSTKFLLPFRNCTDCHGDFHEGQFTERYSSNCAVCHTVRGFKPSSFSFSQHNQGRFSLSGAHIAVPCESCHRKPGANHLVFQFRSFRCGDCHADFHKGQFAAQMTEHSCAQCHSTAEWKMASFDHSKTKFPLVGKHRSVKCADCHKERTINGVRSVQYAGLTRDCQSCHNDIHQNQFRADDQTPCARCHSPEGWHSLLFNHETQSSFQLTGAHKNVPCGGCHKQEKVGTAVFVRYKPVPSRCESCHIKSK